MVFFFFFLTYFTQYENLQFHPCYCKWHYFVLFIVEQCSTAYICHIFLIHSSVNGHLGCFHVVAYPFFFKIYLFLSLTTFWTSYCYLVSFCIQFGVAIFQLADLSFLVPLFFFFQLVLDLFLQSFRFFCFVLFCFIFFFTHKFTCIFTHS